MLPAVIIIPRLSSAMVSLFGNCLAKPGAGVIAESAPVHIMTISATDQRIDPLFKQGNALFQLIYFCFPVYTSTGK